MSQKCCVWYGPCSDAYAHTRGSWGRRPHVAPYDPPHEWRVGLMSIVLAVLALVVVHCGRITEGPCRSWLDASPGDE